MSTRKQANRAEGIVRGVGALIMVLFVAVLVYEVPHLIKNESNEETMRAMMHMIYAFVGLVIAQSILGTIVWLKLIRGKRKD